MIPKSIEIKYEINIKEEDDFFNFRKDYSVIYQNFFNVSTVVEYILNSISDKFTKIKENKMNSHQQIELPLFLLNSLHQVNQNKNQTDINLLKAPFFKALEINFISYESEVIVLEYHEMLSKYINFYLADENSLKIVMGIYLGERGIKHPEVKIGSKVAGILVKFIEKSKLNIGFMALETVVKLKEIVDLLVDCKNFSVNKFIIFLVITRVSWNLPSFRYIINAEVFQ